MSADAISPRLRLATTDASGNVWLTTEGFKALHALGPKGEGSVTYDPPNLADGAGATTTVVCTPARLGQFALASFTKDLQGITLTAWVSAQGVVSVRFQNESGGAVNLASGTLAVRVL